MTYSAINTSLKALIEGVPHQTANLANAAALLYTQLPDVSWAGFYLTEEGAATLTENRRDPQAEAAEATSSVDE